MKYLHIRFTNPVLAIARAAEILNAKSLTKLI